MLGVVYRRNSSFLPNTGTFSHTHLTQEGNELLTESLHAHQQHERDHSFCDLGLLLFAVHTIPVAFLIVAAIIAVAIGIVLLAVCIIDGTEAKLNTIPLSLTHGQHMHHHIKFIRNNSV
jgi:hypothetical protein